MKVENAKQLLVYQRAFELSMAIFAITKRFPPEERFALVSQVRRSSRSVCLNLQEAWAKRRYQAHFISKLTDCDGEINETETSLDFAFHCGYINGDEHKQLVATSVEIGKMLGGMIQVPQKFFPLDIRTSRTQEQ